MSPAPAVARPFLVGGRTVSVSAAVGVGVAGSDTLTCADLLRLAGREMYLAEGGR